MLDDQDVARFPFEERVQFDLAEDQGLNLYFTCTQRPRNINGHTIARTNVGMFAFLSMLFSRFSIAIAQASGCPLLGHFEH